MSDYDVLAYGDAALSYGDEAVQSGQLAVKGSKAGQAKPVKATKTVEVNLAGYFKWDPPIDDVQELALLRAGKWYPATVDFLAVMGEHTNTGMGDFIAILGEIVRHPPGSVSRVNFMTHGNPGTLAITGHNSEKDVFFDATIDDAYIGSLAQPNKQFTAPGVNGSFTLDETRARFAQNAIFVIYSCHGGLDPVLLAALNNLLSTKIIGFRSEIIFCPPPSSKGHFVRKGMKIGIRKDGFACPGDAVADWRGLISHPDAMSYPK